VSERGNLMPIGRFARAVRLSVKALRHYDEEGLLAPAVVDRQTGYRYYARAQAREAVMIAMLRSLDLPLPAIRAALAGSGADLARVLERETERLATELERRRRALRALERIAKAGELAPYVISVREEPAQLVARLSGTTRAERLVDESTAWVFEVMDEVRRAGRELRMPVLCLEEAPEADGSIVVHACAAIAPPPPGFARAEAFEIPAATCAWTLHRGSYGDLALAHHALFAWAQERGHDTPGALREIYRNDPSEVAEDELETEVLLPLG
jgi:DNA-binding transcriptional MerR regulator